MQIVLVVPDHCLILVNSYQLTQGIQETLLETGWSKKENDQNFLKNLTSFLFSKPGSFYGTFYEKWKGLEISYEPNFRFPKIWIFMIFICLEKQFHTCFPTNIKTKKQTKKHLLCTNLPIQQLLVWRLNRRMSISLLTEWSNSETEKIKREVFPSFKGTPVWRTYYVFSSKKYKFLSFCIFWNFALLCFTLLSFSSTTCFLLSCCGSSLFQTQCPYLVTASFSNTRSVSVESKHLSCCLQGLS